MSKTFSPQEAETILKNAAPPWSNTAPSQVPLVRYLETQRKRDGLSLDVFAGNPAVTEQRDRTESGVGGELLAYAIELSALETAAGKPIESLQTVPDWAGNWRTKGPGRVMKT